MSQSSVQDAGVVAELAAARKIAKYPSMPCWKVFTYVSQLWWNHSARLTVRLSRFSVVLVDGLPKFRVKLESAALFQRLSMLIQRFNAVLLHDCFVDEVAGHSS